MAVSERFRFSDPGVQEQLLRLLPILGVPYSVDPAGMLCTQARYLLVLDRLRCALRTLELGEWWTHSFDDSRDWVQYRKVVLDVGSVPFLSEEHPGSPCGDFAFTIQGRPDDPELLRLDTQDRSCDESWFRFLRGELQDRLRLAVEALGLVLREQSEGWLSSTGSGDARVIEELVEAIAAVEVPDMVEYSFETVTEVESWSRRLFDSGSPFVRVDGRFGKSIEFKLFASEQDHRGA